MNGPLQRDPGFGISCSQDFVRIAGPAAKIDHRTSIDGRQCCEQIAHRARAFVLEGDVLFSGPTQFNPVNQVITVLSRAIR
jgi:hypothetical protein